jgi:hypothetical protein
MPIHETSETARVGGILAHFFVENAQLYGHKETMTFAPLAHPLIVCL